MIRQAAALARILGRTAGHAALRRGLTLYLGLFILSVVLFWGKHAMNASEPTEAARQMLGVRVLLLGGWLVLSLPVARALLAAPAAFAVRAFPVGWGTAALVLGAGLLLVESPWTILWFRGQGWPSGAGAFVLAAGAHAAIVGRPRRWYEGLAVLVWLAGFLAGPELFGLGLPALVLGLRRAWISVDVRAARARAPRLTRSPALAIAVAQIVSAWRGQRALVGRWLWLAVAGAGVAWLAIYNNAPVTAERSLTITLCALAPAITLGALGLGGAFLRTEGQARWFLDAAGATPALRHTALALAGAGYGLLFGLAHGLAVAMLAGGPVARVVASSAGLGAALAAAAAHAVRWTDLGTGHDRDRALRAALLLAGGAIGLVVALDELGIVVLVALVAVVSLVLPPPRAPAIARARLAEDRD